MEISTIILPHYSVICSFTKKACKFALKRDSKEKKAFSKTREYNSIFQIPNQSKFSDRVFLTKIEDHNYVFARDIFHNNLKDNIKDKPILTNIAGC